MNDTLVVEINETFEDLGNVHAHEVFWEFAESLANIMKGSILAILQDNVQIFARLDVTFVFDDVGMLESQEDAWCNEVSTTYTRQATNSSSRTHIKILEEIDLGLL